VALAEDLLAAPASQAYVETGKGFFVVWAADGWAA